MSETADSIDGTGSAQAWSYLCQLRDAENHFSRMQAKYRTLASTWLLAGFGGMGFLLTNKLSVPIPTEVLVFAIAFATSLGILTLWILDILVYHRLLDACFSEAVKIEKENPKLPQVRLAMMRSQPGGEVISYMIWFYVSLITGPLVFGGAIFAYWCFTVAVASGILAIVGTLAAITFLLVLVRKNSPSLSRYLPDSTIRSATCPDTESRSTK